MFKFLKNIFKKKEVEQLKFEQPNFAIPPKMRERAVEVNGEKHVRAGDYCNYCQKHISECPYFKD